MLAVVEHQYCPPAAKEIDERVLHRQVLSLLHVDCGGHRRNSRVVIVHWRKLDDVHLTVVCVPHVTGDT